MFKSLLRRLGIMNGTLEPNKFDPIYGFPTRSIDEWFARNPKLKADYDAELAARSLRTRDTRGKRPRLIWRRGC